MTAATSPESARASTGLDTGILVLALTLGAVVRLLPVLTSDFPVNDGGLFAAMIDDLVAHGPVAPATASYNAAQIPFAYPPLGLYLGALLVSLGLPTLDVLRFVPALISILAIPAWYALARELVSVRVAVVATLIYSLLPKGYEWTIAGGGITRALGVLLAILAVRSAVRYFRDRERFDGVLAGGLVGLCVMAHPEAGVFAAGSVVGAAILLRSGVRNLVFVGLTALLVASPWLAYVLVSFGPGPLLAAGGSRLSAYPLTAANLLQLRITDEVYLPIGLLLGIVGLFLAATSGRWWLPVWVALPYLLLPAGAGTFVMMPWSLVAAITITEVAMPRLPRSRRPLVATVGIALMTVASAWSAYSPDSPLWTVPAPVREAMRWARAELPDDASVVVVTGTHWAVDAVSEWFPYLTGRESVATMQGQEFTGKWSERLHQWQGLAFCSHQTANCLEDLIDLAWPEADVVMIPKGPMPGSRDVECCLALRRSLAYFTDVVYDGTGATVFQVRRSNP